MGLEPRVKESEILQPVVIAFVDNSVNQGALIILRIDLLVGPSAVESWGVWEKW